MNYMVGVGKIMISPTIVILDFSLGNVLDISGIEAITKTRASLLEKGKTVILKGLPAEAYRHLPEDVQTEDKDVAPQRRSSLNTLWTAVMGAEAERDARGWHRR